MSKARGPAR